MAALLTLWRLLAFLNVVHLVLARGKTIDIFNDGERDILQMRKTDKNRYGISGSKFRNAIFSNSHRKWNVKDSDGNTIIPYKISGQYDYDELNVIKKAMARIEDNTCIRFRERDSERDYIDIRNRYGEGCYTSVGRQRGRSVVMLEANDESTCMETHIVQHELLHVVGLWHEHMRYDRDKYIKVHYENIRQGYESQFEKVSSSESTVYGIPYDYKSVMHYGKSAFALPGRVSMETLDPKYTNVIGRQKDASPSDYKKVCKIYDCAECSGGGTGRDDDKPRPTTTKPKPQPTTPTHEKCLDMFPNFCTVMIYTEFVDCRYSYGKRFCCATCKAIADRHGDNPFGSSYGDYYDGW